MPGATIATYNLRWDTPDRLVRGDLHYLARNAQARASVMVLTEAAAHQDAPVDGFARDHGWRQFWPGGDTRVIWDHQVWAALDVHGSEKVHDRGPEGSGVPARYVVWQALHHRPSGTNHLFIGSHLVSGYAGHEKAFQAWRDAAAMAHLLTITAVAANLMRTRADLHYHHLCGDLNSNPRNTKEWWYPSRLLASLWEPETLPATIDWLLHSRLSTDRGMTTRRRWKLNEADGMDSDHPAHLKRVAFPKALP